jgi:K+-transporting ATPase c subunit
MASQTQDRQFGILGEPRVNVLKLAGLELACYFLTGAA